MEALEQALRREAQKKSLQNSKIFDPIVVNNLTQLKRLLTEFDPGRNKSDEIDISAKMIDNNQTYAVSTKTKSRSRRDILIEGFQAIRDRQKLPNNGQAIEIDGKPMSPISLPNTIAWLDRLVQHWLGGKRDGIIIYWDIDGRRYRYDIFQHKLTAEQLDEYHAATTSPI